MTNNNVTDGNGPMNPDLDTLSGAYVLNALSDEERTAFEARLSESPELRQEVAGLNDTALLLGYAAPPVTPSEGLRSSILDLLDSTPQLPPLETTSTARHSATSTPSAPQTAPQDPSPVAAPIEFQGEAEILQPIPLARQRWFMRPGVMLIGAAAAVGLIFGGVGIANQFNPVPSVSQPTAQSDLSQILAANDVQHTAADIKSGGKATLYWSNDLSRSAVVLDGMTSLPSGKTYQLWYIKGTDIKSAGTVAVNSNSVTQVLQGNLEQGDTVGITIEPTGGSKQPTTTPIAALQSA